MTKGTTDQDGQPLAKRIGSECLISRTRLLGRTLTKIYDDALRPLGMTAAQMNLLVVIANSGPIGQTDVGRHLNMEKSTLSRNVERMRKQGWITKTGSGPGRGLLLSLTAKGTDQIERSGPLWKSAQAETAELLGQADAASLKRIVDSLSAGLAR
ncbi:MAG: DNA-binding MarR family transcriptional regulator [Myxococcota bacterium]